MTELIDMRSVIEEVGISVANPVKLLVGSKRDWFQWNWIERFVFGMRFVNIEMSSVVRRRGSIVFVVNVK